MKKIKTKIIFYCMTVALSLGVILSIVMIVSMIRLTDSILLETLQPMAKIASQSISSNLHLLSDRIFIISDSESLTSKTNRLEQKKEFILKQKSGIEFSWIGIYNLDGSLYTGDDLAPINISEQKYFKLTAETENIVIGEPSASSNGLEIAISAPIFCENELLYSLVGSYKYDILNDVLSNINIGETGEAYIINEDGIIVADKNIDNISQKVNVLQTTDSDELKKIYTQMINFQTGSSVVKVEKENYLISFSPVSGTMWSLAISVPESEFMSATKRVLLVCIITSLLILIIATLFIYRFSKKLSDSLTITTDRIEQLSKGNLSDGVKIIYSKDEIEILSTSLSYTVSSMNAYISKIKFTLSELSNGNLSVEVPDDFDGDFATIRQSLIKIALSLNEMIEAINISSNHVSVSTVEVSESSKKLFDSSFRQKNALAELNMDINKISQKISDVVTEAKNVKKIVAQTNERVELSNRQMESMLTAMDSIHKNTDEISSISKLIEEISSQTNILALNASIEAANVGEAGAGFAVIANRVRELAMKSTEASKQTSNIVSNSQKSIDQGIDLAYSTAESFNKISEISKQLSDITQDLTKVTDEQQRAIESVQNRIFEVSEIAESNLNTAAESESSSKTFSEQAQILKGLVDKFKLKKGGSDNEFKTK